MGIIYIRVVKFICIQEDKGALQITTVITLTSDLGESSYPLATTLQCSITYDKSQTVHTLQWTGVEAVQKYKFVSKGFRGILTDQKLHVSFTAQSTLQNSIDEIVLPITAFFVEDHQGELIVPVHFSHNIDTSFSQTTQRTFRICSREVNLTEFTKESIVSHVWDGGLVLAALVASIIHTDQTPPRHDLNHKPRKRRKQEKNSGEGHGPSQEEQALNHLQATLAETLSSGTTVLELGTGIGLVGITTSWLPGLDITLTDLSTAKDLVTQNIVSAAGPSTITFRNLEWESETVKMFEADVLMMSDVTYNESYHGALEECIKSLAATGWRIIFASKYRHISERSFIDSFLSTYKVVARAVFDKDRFHVKRSEDDTQIGDVEVLVLET